MKHIFLVNPSAHSGQGKKMIPLLYDICKYLNLEAEFFESKSPRHLRELTKEQISRFNGEPFRLYSVGGDGTANIILNEIAPYNIELAIIPAGTGNDIVRSITGNSFKNLKSYLEGLINGKVIYIDVPMINDRYFMNISSIGLDAIVNENFSKSIKRFPWLPSKLLYYLVAIFTVFRDNSIKVDISFNNQQRRQSISVLAIANASYYGGGVKPCPETFITDGLLDLCLVEGLPLRRVIKLLPKYMANSHYQEKEVSILRTKELTIHSNKLVIVNIDGEIAYYNNLLYKMSPYKQPLIVPSWSPLL